MPSFMGDGALVEFPSAVAAVAEQAPGGALGADGLQVKARARSSRGASATIAPDCSAMNEDP